MRNNLACLGGYPTHLDVADMSNLFSFCVYMIKADDAPTVIQFSQTGETVMQMLMYQFKLTKC